MSTFMIEPGERLAGRYRLDQLVSETGGAALWKATDETLARLVAVWTFAEGFPRTSEVVRAARAASRIPDSRVTQVFDADDSGQTTYVVEEWVVGQSLEQLLAQGPLETDRAAGLVAEAAEAVAAANASGIFHLCLDAGKLIWSSGGAVKITGFGVDAAIRGVSADDPGRSDAQGLGKLLYAAITAHWPGPEVCGLRPAPIVSGAPCQPAQIRAGVPEYLNGVICRATFQNSDNNGQPPLGSSQEVADALADVPRLVPLPAEPSPPPVSSARPEPARPSRAAEPLGVPAHQLAPARGGQRRGTAATTTNKVLVGSVALLVLVTVIVGAWTLGRTWSDYSSDQPETEQQAGAEQGSEMTALKPAGVSAFDPPGHDEHSDTAPNAIDDDPSTSWKTEGYNSAQFGNLKEGVGLLIDMGKPVTVKELDVVLGEAQGASFEVRMGDQPSLGALTPKATKTGVSGSVPVKLAEPVEARYVLLWFTQLPPDDARFRVNVYDIKLRGNT